MSGNRPHVSVGWAQHRRNKRASGTRSHKVGKGKRVPLARYVTDGLALPHIACGVTENSSLREQRREMLSILGILRKLAQRLTMLFDDHAVAHEAGVGNVAGDTADKIEIIVCSVFFLIIIGFDGDAILMFKECFQKCAVGNATRMSHDANLISIHFYEGEHLSVIGSFQIAE